MPTFSERIIRHRWGGAVLRIALKQVQSTPNRQHKEVVPTTKYSHNRFFTTWSAQWRKHSERIQLQISTMQWCHMDASHSASCQFKLVHRKPAASLFLLGSCAICATIHSERRFPKDGTFKGHHPEQPN